MKSSVKNRLVIFFVYLAAANTAMAWQFIGDQPAQRYYGKYFLNLVTLSASYHFLGIPVSLSTAELALDEINNLLAQTDSVSGSYLLPREDYSTLKKDVGLERNRKKYASDSLYIEVTTDSTGRKYLIEEKIGRASCRERV